jgi:hypothetical protein
MGIQYADLPRISTAGIEAGAKSMDVLGQSLDRMIEFAYQRQVTSAEKKAKQYAIENPLTKQQVDDALASGEGTKVRGAGRIFQQTYDEVQASLLSTELQLQANKALTAVNATIESGQPFDLGVVEREIKDMVDGYTSTVMALDPDQGLRFKATVTSAGNAIYQKAADRAVKTYQAGVNANFEQALSEVPAVLEAIISKSGAIDPETNQPIDIDLLIEAQRKPFLDSVQMTGTNKHLVDFNKAVIQAKKGALTDFMSDREEVPDAAAAIQRINKSDFGSLTPVFKSLSRAEKDSVRDTVMKSYASEYTALQQTQQLEANQKKEQWTALSLEFIRPNTGSARKRQIVNEGVAIGQITLQQAQDMLQPPAAKTDMTLYNQLYDQIQRGVITSYQELLPYQSKLSDSDYKSLGTAATNTQGKQALANMRRFVGIRENQFVPEDKQAKESLVVGFYTEELGKQIKNDQGVLVYQTPTQAMDKAIERFEANKGISAAVAAQEAIKKDIEKAFADAGLPKPNVPVEQIDPSMIRDLKVRQIVTDKQKSYMDSVRGMRGQ